MAREETSRKKGISLTLDDSLLEWLEEVAEQEALSVSYLVNRFCLIAKDVFDNDLTFSDRKRIKQNMKEIGLKDGM
jgi:hypothetical protein